MVLVRVSTPSSHQLARFFTPTHATCAAGAAVAANPSALPRVGSAPSLLQLALSCGTSNGAPMMTISPHGAAPFHSHALGGGGSGGQHAAASHPFLPPPHFPPTISQATARAIHTRRGSDGSSLLFMSAASVSSSACASPSWAQLGGCAAAPSPQAPVLLRAKPRGSPAGFHSQACTGLAEASFSSNPAWTASCLEAEDEFELAPQQQRDAHRPRASTFPAASSSASGDRRRIFPIEYHDGAGVVHRTFDPLEAASAASLAARAPLSSSSPGAARDHLEWDPATKLSIAVTRVWENGQNDGEAPDCACPLETI